MFTKLFIKDIYEENLYFHLMMDIIQNPNPLNEKYTEKHHIIPRFIYRDKNIDIDNSDDNIINLSIKNHILIHYYAAKCCKSEYKWKFVNSILRTLGNIKLSEFENKIDEISNELADTKKLLRETPRPKEIREKSSWDHYRFTAEERKEKFGNRKGKIGPNKNKKFDKKWCENISKGRKGILKGHTVSIETRLKISEKAKIRMKGNKLSKKSIEKIKNSCKKTNESRLKLYNEYKKENNCTWNEFQIYLKEKIKKLYIEFNLSKEDKDKLNFKQFKRYFYENCRL